ncbi:hypothetical protein PISMIDRAFT_682192 [Pisolithus microcarpus 441]|uniref:Unplaced genomic scaffold scaffold_78, whole genome shotgun sequence n=1 Tax=Pisolithus microcarpus 441 TaxID=765257 RepID=A0A0C9ZDR5_9AGAM|nr:hypothetical protein PISMIDRAFT_682192 [Pisolithus microcarpus 441]
MLSPIPTLFPRVPVTFQLLPIRYHCEDRSSKAGSYTMLPSSSGAPIYASSIVTQ